MITPNNQSGVPQGGNLTPFEKAVQAVDAGELTPPVVSYQGANVPYWVYQLNVHHMYLKLMTKGIQNGQVKLKDLKWYYGLKGRTAADVLPKFEELKNRVLG